MKAIDFLKQLKNATVETPLIVDTNALARDSMRRIAEKWNKKNNVSKSTGPLCTDTTKVHPVLSATDDDIRHSIGSICPSCGISLLNHGEAVRKEGVQ